MAASELANRIAASVDSSLHERVLDVDEIEACAKGVDAELHEVREVLEQTSKHKTPSDLCWCEVYTPKLGHVDECQRARALYERLKIK